MKPVRYAILPVLAVLFFGIGTTARADSVGLVFGPAGIYYFDYHSGGYRYGHRHEYRGYRHDYRGYRHDYKRPYWAHHPYWHGYRSYGYWHRPPARRFYRHDYRDYHHDYRDDDHHWR